VVLSRQIAIGWASTRRSIRSIPPAASWTRLVVGEEHYNTARGRCRRCCSATRSLQDIIAILGMDELSEEDKLIVYQRAQSAAFPVAALQRRPKIFTGQDGKIVPLMMPLKR